MDYPIITFIYYLMDAVFSLMFLYGVVMFLLAKDDKAKVVRAQRIIFSSLAIMIIWMIYFIITSPPCCVILN